MKKSISLIFILTLLLSLAACGSGGGKGESDTAAPEEGGAGIENIKTMKDVFAYDSVSNGSMDNVYAYVFEEDGITYRAIAEMPDDVTEAYYALDVSDEKYDEKAKEMLGSLEVTKLENLTEMIPPQEELDKLVGKTGQDLLDDGWTFWSWDLESMEFGMYKGPFAYTVIFEGTLKNTDDFDEAEAGALTVNAISYDGIGDATVIE